MGPVLFLLIGLVRVTISVATPSNDTLGPLERDHQILGCTPGRAVFDISWREPIKGYRLYSIRCANFTAGCLQQCLYDTECTTQKYGQNLFLGGIYAVYDRFEGKQVFFLFLCCNTTQAPNGTQCSNRLQLKEAKSLTPNIPVTFRAAKSSYPDGIYRHRLKNDEDPKLYLEICQHDRSKHVSPSCPLLSQFLGSGQGSSGSGSGGSGASFFGYDASTIYAAAVGTAPGIVALATPTAIAALILSVQTEPTQPLDPCCCLGTSPTNCFGVGLSAGPQPEDLKQFPSTDAAACHAACFSAYPECAHAGLRAGFCILHRPSQVPQLDEVPEAHYCYTKAAGRVYCG